jgi:ligand-binding sensor domain-containing protein/signal transduction histidine kinase
MVKRRRRGTLACCILLWLAAGSAAAVRLPVRRVTSADGLAHDQVRCIHADARGFLWFGTLDGLSRFDGETFRTYGTQNGLLNASISSLLETRDGNLWVGTMDGLCRFAPDGPPERLFECHPLGSTPLARSVLSLFEDRQTGAIWAGTADGLFRVERAPGGLRVQAVDLDARVAGETLEVKAFAEDRQGCLWVGMEEGLSRRCGAGPFRHFPLQRRRRDQNRVFGLLIDGGGRVWAGLAYDGVLVFMPGGADWNPPRYLLEEARRFPARMEPAGESAPAAGTAGTPGGPYTRHLRLPQRVGEAIDIMPAEGLAHPMARGGLWASSDGTIWIGTVGGVCRFAGGRVERFGSGGLEESIHFVGAEDRAGNLWFGTEHSGALRLSAHGLVTYAEEDGLPQRSVSSVFLAADGAVHALNGGNVVSRFDGLRFTPTVARVPAGIDPGWGRGQSSFQDSHGEWWIATGAGLLRFPATVRTADLGRLQPRALYTTADGLGGNAVFRLYEDSRHDIWIGTHDGARVTRWERATETFHRYPEPAGFPAASPTAFAEDAGGALWMGFYLGGLARYENDHVTFYPPGLPGIPADGVEQLYRDSRGRIWAACRTSGLICIEEPRRTAHGPPLRPRRYSAADGLSSGFVTCVSEDGYRRLYVCTGRGIDRLDLATRAVAHFTLADGLASSEVAGTVRDRSGDLWFATSAGLSRLTPRPARVTAPPQSLLMGVRVDGRAQAVSQWGATDLSGLVLLPGERRLEIAFAAIAAEPGETPLYQHRLAGLDRDWGTPSADGSVLYAALAPGRYDFLVRALAGDGRPGSPARLAFRILAPWWRRPWVVALAVAALCAVAYAAYRFRLAHFLALERVRTRIATDLHDDLGASLSRISLLSEVAARQIPASAARSSEMVREIGGLARELFDATADIVWAIDPRRDNLGSLVTRLSEYARDVLAPSGASWSLHQPHGLEEVVLAADPRRELFLLLKEAVHNAARHSGASAVALTLTLAGQRLRVEVCDDGRGFAVPPAGEPPGGDGLRNMQARAAALAGSCTIVTAAGRGTRVQVEIPVPS